MKHVMSAVLSGAGGFVGKWCGWGIGHWFPGVRVALDVSLTHCRVCPESCVCRVISVCAGKEPYHDLVNQGGQPWPHEMRQEMRTFPFIPVVSSVTIHVLRTFLTVFSGKVFWNFRKDKHVFDCVIWGVLIKKNMSSHFSLEKCNFCCFF